MTKNRGREEGGKQRKKPSTRSVKYFPSGVQYKVSRMMNEKKGEEKERKTYLLLLLL